MISAAMTLFVLRQCGACAGASGSNIPLINDDGLDAGFRQRKRHQGPGNPTADDHRITHRIVLQGRVVFQEAVIDRPKGMTGS